MHAALAVHVDTSSVSVPLLLLRARFFISRHSSRQVRILAMTSCIYMFIQKRLHDGCFGVVLVDSIMRPGTDAPTIHAPPIHAPPMHNRLRRTRQQGMVNIMLHSHLRPCLCGFRMRQTLFCVRNTPYASVCTVPSISIGTQ